MNTSNFRNTLIEIAQGDNSNLLSKIIAFYYPSLDVGSREQLFESLLNRLELNSDNKEFDFEKLKKEIREDIEVLNLEDYQGKDYRIKQIEISNLRGIPNLDNDNPIPYGINLLDDNNKLQNAIILANNGVGKSSVFAGLEMIFAEEIGEKKIRTFNPDSLKTSEYEDYLQRVNSLSKPYCSVKTISGDFNLNDRIFKDKDVLKLLNPQSQFISEYDVIRNGQNYYSSKTNQENSIHYIVAESLGLSEYINFLQVAEQIPTYTRRKEITAKNSIEKEINENKLKIKNNKADIQSKQMQLEELKVGMPLNENQSQSHKLENINKLLTKQFPTINSTDFLKILQEYRTSYIEYSSIETNKRSAIEKEFLDVGKNLLHDYDDCPFCKSSNLSIEEIKTQVEQRLEDLNRLSEIDKQIKENYKATIYDLLISLQSFKTFYNLIETDRAQLGIVFNKSDILEEENRLYAKLAPIVNDEGLIEYIENLSQKNIPTDAEFESLMKLLNDNEELFGKVINNWSIEISTFIKKRNEVLNNELQNILSKNESLDIEQSILKIDNEIKELHTQIKIAEERNEKLESEDLKKAIQKVEYVTQIKEEITIFNSKLGLKVNEIVETGFQAFKEPVEEIMNDYFNDDPQYKLQIELKEFPLIIDGEEYSSKIIVVEIVDKYNELITTSPDHYFNTFRYKLFGLMISLSIALASRRMYKVNLPLVIDDLFYGSDYVSKNTFSEFIQKIIKLYEKHTPDMPLQIILFTHDNFIYKSAIEGIENLSIENKNLNLDKTIISRMFPVNDKEMAETENGFKYWNLIYN
ncbi:hypothetical protein CMU01_08700 [Elizabethkingia anophelis]|nr:hypothetical protein [Elizabethkingia anophelis]MDV3876113.1 hypothetical protein [Elizabethkingia anophelis]